GTTSTDTDQQPGLAWFDLESAAALPQGQNPFQVLKGTAWNWIYAPSAGNYAAAPSWSKATGDDFVVFTMTSNVTSGRLGTGTGHLYQVPYSKTGPQAATPIPGDGSNASFAQYYGTLSGDDAYVVYDQVPASTAVTKHNAPSGSCSSPPCTWDGMYMQPASELFVIPTSGGTGVRLAANDPDVCGTADQPRHQQHLGQVVASVDAGARRNHLLLDHLLLMATGDDRLDDRRADRAAFHDGDRENGARD